MYHSTMVLLDGVETVYVQGSLAVAPFITSTLGDTVTVTAPLQTENKNTQKNKDLYNDFMKRCHIILYINDKNVLCQERPVYKNKMEKVL